MYDRDDKSCYRKDQQNAQGHGHDRGHGLEHLPVFGHGVLACHIDYRCYRETIWPVDVQSNPGTAPGDQRLAVEHLRLLSFAVESAIGFGPPRSAAEAPTYHQVAIGGDV